MFVRHYYRGSRGRASSYRYSRALPADAHFVYRKTPAPPVTTNTPPQIQGGTAPTQGTGGGDDNPPAPVTYPETTGGAANTWTDYTNAGGTHGPTIPAFATVRIACRRTGFRVADGNTWWYKIASSPWNGRFYVSADAFYNNGHTSGSLHGTPFVDTAVPVC